MDIKANRYEANIAKSYFFTLIGNMNFTSGLWMIYLATRGLSMLQIGFLEGIFHITSLFMEIPTGALADVFGRKACRSTGRLLAALSSVLIVYARSYMLLSLAFILSALSYNLESGSGEALLFDSLKTIGKENQYIRVTGLQEAVFQIAGVICLIVGGWIGQYNYYWAYWASIMFSLTAFIFSFSFIEPPIFDKPKQKTTIKTVFSQMVESFRTIVRNKKVAFILVLTQTLLSFSTLLFFYLQNYWKNVGFGEFTIGVFLASGSLAGAFIANIIYKIDKKIGNRRMFLFFSWISCLCILGIAFFSTKVVFFILLSMMDSALFVASNNYVNLLIPSYQRATILSVGSMLFSLVMISLFPVFGFFVDCYGFNIAFYSLACLAIIVGILITIPLLNPNSFFNKPVNK
jgi:MFS family permease